MWSEPKVDWKSTDYYNIDDWRRVRSNLEHLLTWLRNLKVSGSPLLETDRGRGYDELPYVHLVNNMEKNLAHLKDLLGVDFTEDLNQKTWYDRLDSMYTSNPTYQDWIRWEKILSEAHQSIQYIDTYIFLPISGSCYCGSGRTLVRFSRGR